MMQQQLLDTVRALYEDFGVDGLQPAYVVIGKDCRDETDRIQDLTGKVGIRLGSFYYPSVLDVNLGEEDESERLHDAICVQPDEYDEESDFRIANPLIVGKNGELVWGLECYWTEMNEQLITDLEALHDQLGVRFDETHFQADTRAIVESLRRRIEQERSANEKA